MSLLKLATLDMPGAAIGHSALVSVVLEYQKGKSTVPYVHPECYESQHSVRGLGVVLKVNARTCVESVDCGCLRYPKCKSTHMGATKSQHSVRGLGVVVKSTRGTCMDGA